jgi:hypothetical protein
MGKTGTFIGDSGCSLWSGSRHKEVLPVKKETSRSIIILTALLIVYGAVTALQAADNRNFLVIPGKSAGFIVLGRPIPPSLLKELGTPSTFTKPSPGEEGTDTGNYFWEHTLNVKLNDGKGDMNVFQVLILSPRYRTEKGIGIGSSFEAVKKAYPAGRKGEGFDCDFSWSLPGLEVSIYQNKVCTMAVIPTGAPQQ